MSDALTRDGAALRAMDTDRAILGSDGTILIDWIEEACGGRLVRAERTSGGNRYQGWRIDVARAPSEARKLYLRFQPRPPAGIEPYTVRREAEIYRALQSTGVPIPELVAIHPTLHAMITERVPGQAEYRRIKDPAEKAAVARDCIHALAKLHSLDAADLGLTAALGPLGSVRDAVRAEVELWAALYEETGRADPLVEFSLAWLRNNLPDAPEPAILVHGDAGVGNFLFENGRMTALLDWELSHFGDPMEDLAWFTMRSVMEPVPDMPERMREYEAASGRPIDVQRILYYRVLISFRIVIIRHRNVTGEPGPSIVSKGLNRRLVVDAIAEASGSPPPQVEPVEVPPTEASALFDAVLDSLQSTIVPRSNDGHVVAQAKNSAKILKYLREVDRIGPAIREREHAALEALVGRKLASVEEGQRLLVEDLRAGRIAFPEALAYFARHAAWGEQLAAGAMGGLAYRRYPPIR